MAFVCTASDQRLGNLVDAAAMSYRLQYPDLTGVSLCDLATASTPDTTGISARLTKMAAVAE